MLKVKVIGIPVFYDGERHEKDSELIIKAEHRNDSIFEVLEELETTTDREKELAKLKVPQLQELLAEGTYDTAATKAELIALIVKAESEEKE